MPSNCPTISFDTDRLRVHFATSRNRQIRYLDSAELDFACSTPVEMLDVHAVPSGDIHAPLSGDIHAPLSGDIHQELEHYTFEANLQHTRNFLEKWGGDIPPLQVEVLERGFQSFPCEQRAAP